MTQDIDIVLSLQPDNVASALKVLGKLGMRPVPPVDLASFADASMRKKWQDEKSMIVLSLMHPSKPLLSVDLFVESPIPFDELLASAVAMAFAGSSIRVASIDHLIRMKKASGRSMDLSDVTALEELRNE